MSSAAGDAAVAAEALRSQVSTLGKQLTGLYRCSEGGGMATDLQRSGELGSGSLLQSQQPLPCLDQPSYTAGLATHGSTFLAETSAGLTASAHSAAATARAAAASIRSRSQLGSTVKPYGTTAAVGSTTYTAGQYSQYSPTHAGILHGTSSISAGNATGQLNMPRYIPTGSNTMPALAPPPNPSRSGSAVASLYTPRLYQPYEPQGTYGSTTTASLLRQATSPPRLQAPSQTAATRSWQGSAGVLLHPAGSHMAYVPPYATPSRRTMVDSVGGHGRGVGWAGEWAGVGGGKEEARLRDLLQEMRADRRRLEDKLMTSDPQGLRLVEMRDDLERQIGLLSQQRDMLQGEVGSMSAACNTAAERETHVMVLQDALASEQHTAAQHHNARQELESKVQELAAALEQLSTQHTQAVSVLTSERDALATKQRKLVAKLSAVDAELVTVRVELEASRKEAQARSASLTEVKASAEVVQRASAQMQAQLLSVKKDADMKHLDILQQLSEARTDADQARSTAVNCQQALQETTTQLQQSSAREDCLKSERKRLTAALQTEHANNAQLNSQLETARLQASAADARAVDVEADAQKKLAAAQQQHTTRMAAVTKQFEAQLSAAERAASAAQRDADNSHVSGEKLVVVQTAMRQEREALLTELEGVRAELTMMQKERDEMASKVSLLRSEVKATMDDVRADRDARILAATHQHETQICQLRAQLESAATLAASEHQAAVVGLSRDLQHTRAELLEAQRAADKQRAAAVLLKEQLAAALVVRDDLEREVAQERNYGEELGRIVAQIKSAR